MIHVFAAVCTVTKNALHITNETKAVHNANNATVNNNHNKVLFA